MLMVVSAVFAYAENEKPDNVGFTVVQVTGSEVFKVVYKGETTGKVRLNVYNSHAEILLSKTFYETSGFIFPLNFSGVAYGEYTIELSDVKGKHLHKVSIVRPARLISDKFVHISKLSADNRFLVSVAGPAQNEKIRVAIFDQSGELIFSESTRADGDFARMYNVKRPAEGYTFEVYDRSGMIKTIRFE